MSFSYSISSRQTAKKGTVYDARFRVVDGSGKEVQKRLCGFKTKAEAKRAAVKFLSHYVPPAPVAAAPAFDQTEKISFEKALAAFLAVDKVQTKESTQYEKVGLYAKHITPYFRGIDIRAITKRMVAEWQDTMWAMRAPNGKLYSQKHLLKLRSMLSRLLAWCSERYDTVNYLKDLSTPKRREVKKEIEFYDLAEFTRFIAQADEPQWRTAFMFLFYIGCRVGEMQALSESDITDDGVVINKTLTKKTFDDTPYKRTETKNYKNRVVPIPEVLRAALSEYLAWKRANGYSEAYLFGGDTPLPLQSIRNHLNRYADAAGVKRIRIHGFRHSYVSMCAHVGATPLAISKLIGDTVSTVMQVYMHLWADDAGAVVAKIDEICGNFVP